MTVRTAPPRVRLEFSFAADVETVFHAWTDAGVLASWMGPLDGVPADVEVDLRVGGRYRFGMGKRTSRGEYLEIERPRRLRFTWVWDDDPEVETEVTLSFAPVEGGTRLILEHERLPLEVDCFGFETGWRMTLAKLRAKLGS